MQKIFIVDASGYLYSCYFAIRNMTNSQGESTNALFGFIRSIQKLIKDFQPSHLVAVFDGPRNAKKREEIYADYKAHRSSMPQDLPYQISWAQEFCTFMGIPYLNIPEVEADDTMGAIAKWVEKQEAMAYLCSSDKDLCQLVSDKVFMLNTRKDNQLMGSQEVEQQYGVPPSKMVDLLALTGDSSDNVPGVPGIGPKTAAQLLKEYDSLDHLLTHPEASDNNKKRALIIANADKALISRRLVTIDLSVNVPHADSFYSIKSPDLQKLKSFYLKMGFNSLLRDLEANTTPVTEKEQKGYSAVELPFEITSYHLVDDEEALYALVEQLKKQKEICFDIQTTDTQPMLAELVGISFCIKAHTAWYVPTNGKLGLERVMKVLKPLFEDSSIKFYGHDVKYECHALESHGINLANVCFDTILASYLLNSHNRQHSLETLFLQYFGKAKQEISSLTGKGKNLISIKNVAPNLMCSYCCESVDFTFQLKLLLEKELKERHLDKLLYQIELPLSKVLAKMERNGIFLDVPCLEVVSRDIQQQIKHVEQEIFDLAGETFNLNSPKQLSHILQHKLHIPLPKKTASGFSTNADILESLKDDHPIAKVLLDYRSLEKLRSTYLDTLSNAVNPHTKRIHCTFKQSVAATGRLSCQDPNLQNIPVRTQEGRRIREAFRPQKNDWCFLAADYSQVELRLLAHLSEDKNLIHAFQNNEDIHIYTAASMFNVPLNQVTKEQRHQAKAINFGIIYGQQAFGLAKELRIEVKQAAAFIEMYFQRYQHVKEYLEFCKESARKTGKAVTFTGRERLLPEIYSKNAHLRMLAERLAVNTPIQGAAADLIKLAMLTIDKKLSQMHLQGYMILQIHDELIFEIPDEESPHFVSLVREAMQNVFHLKVPLIVDITIGKNWKEC